jgi:hypothetical protein
VENGLSWVHGNKAITQSRLHVKQKRYYCIEQTGYLGLMQFYSHPDHDHEFHFRSNPDTAFQPVMQKETVASVETLPYWTKA